MRQTGIPSGAWLVSTPSFQPENGHLGLSSEKPLCLGHPERTGPHWRHALLILEGVKQLRYLYVIPFLDPFWASHQETLNQISHASTPKDETIGILE